MSGREGWVPNPNPAHPPFEVNNKMAVRHGAYADQLVLPAAQAIFDELLEQAQAPRSRTAYLLDPAFRAPLWDYSVLRARRDRVLTWLGEHDGDLDDEGQPRPATQLLGRLDKQIATAQRELGLTPAARARLGRDVALATHVGGLDLSEGRRLRLEAERKQAELVAGGDDQAGDDGEIEIAGAS